MYRICGYLFAVLAPFMLVCAHALSLEDTVAFVSAHMPPQDRGTVSPERLRRDAAHALSMRGHFPWSEEIPDAVFLNNVAPYAVLNEERGEWRAALSLLYEPLVAPCRTAREAVWRVVSQMSRDTGVVYSANRRRAVMSPLEALREKKVSCTGQSILVVCALRSFGIPARVAGLKTWNHIPGNHTWAEAWYEGGWHMVEFNEREENTPWVMEGIGMLDPSRAEQRVIASSWKPADAAFPTIECSEKDAPVHGVDETARYMGLARDWYERSGLSPDCQRLFVDSVYLYLDVNENMQSARIPLHILLLAPDGSLVAEGESPGEQTDMRRYLNFTVPRKPGYRLEARRGGRNGPLQGALDLQVSDAPSQVVSVIVFPDES